MQEFNVPVGNFSIFSRSSAVTDDGVVLLDKTSDVLKDGTVNVEMFSVKLSNQS